MEKNIKNNTVPHIKKFFDSFKPLNFKGGQLIIRPDIPISGVYYIESGIAKLCSLNENGDERIILFYKKGDYFPLTLVYGSSLTHIYCECVTDMVLKYAEKEIFCNFIYNDIDALREFAKDSTGIIKRMANRIENLGYIKAYPRLLYGLLYLAKRFGEFNDKKITIVIPISYKDLANFVSLARETVNREFEKLENENIVKYIDHQIVIKDMEKLRNELTVYGDISWLN